MTEFFKSEQVQQDLQSIFSYYQEISSETARLGLMGREDKFELIADCKNLIDKQKTFYARLCLASTEDAEASDMKERINLMSKAFGFQNLYECLDKLTETLDAARKKELDK